MNKGIAAFALACFLSAVVCAQQKIIKDAAEYNAYITALNQEEPVAKAAAMEAFAATYPNSVVKIDALEQAMAAYQQTGNNAKVLEAAVRILESEPANVRALAIAAFIKRATATANGDLKMAQEAGGFAQAGLGALPNWRKPEEMSDQDFAKVCKQMEAIFYGAAGFAALEAKDFAVARESYLKSVAIDPSNMQDTYQLAIAELQMTPLDVNGFWHAAKVINLAQNQINPGGADAVASYARAVYVRYHGSENGWDGIVKAAAAETAPPPDFAPSARHDPRVAELACKALAENDPDDLSFSDWEFVLALRDEGPCNQDAADRVWAHILRKEKHGEAKLQFPVKVISASETSIEAAITDENQQANKVDLKVVMEKPLRVPLKAGQQLYVIGVITNYSPKPFAFFMEKGEVGEEQQ